MNHIFTIVPKIKKRILIHTLHFLVGSFLRSFDRSYVVPSLISFDRSFVMFSFGGSVLLSFDLSCTCPFVSLVVTCF